MILDNRTLLFSLVMISGLIALSLAIVSRGDRSDGLRAWAGAMGLESLAWALIAARGAIPDLASILIANLCMVAAQAMKLAALYQFRERPWPRGRCLLPTLVMFILIAALDYTDFRHRVIYGGLIYIAQMWLLLEILRTDTASKRGGAWWLLFGATATLIPILALRALAALFGTEEFSRLGSSVAPSTLQVLVFVFLSALDILGSLGFILMVKERSDFELRALAMTDFLTKTLNRRAFTMRAEQALAMAQRTGAPLALLMIDIDHFKRINDEHGHAAGDAVLTAVARSIGVSLRKQDTLGRYGGEEFGVLLPATNLAGAQVLAEKLRSMVENMPCRVGSKHVSVTISIGITLCQASCTTCRSNLNELLDDADKALYQAKHSGRNRSVATPAGCMIAC